MNKPTEVYRKTVYPGLKPFRWVRPLNPPKITYTKLQWIGWVGVSHHNSNWWSS